MDDRALIALADGYHPRETRSHGTRQAAGTTIKVYGISAPGRRLEPPQVQALVDVAGTMLGADCVGLACVIVHAGADGDYLLVHTWINDYMSRLTILLGPPDRPDLLRPAPPGLAPCVWEAAVLAHERQAYVDRVLSGHGPLTARLQAWADDVLPATAVQPSASPAVTA